MRCPSSISDIWTVGFAGKQKFFDNGQAHLPCLHHRSSAWSSDILIFQLCDFLIGSRTTWGENLYNYSPIKLASLSVGPSSSANNGCYGGPHCGSWNHHMNGSDHPTMESCGWSVWPNPFANVTWAPKKDTLADKKWKLCTCTLTSSFIWKRRWN